MLKSTLDALGLAGSQHKQLNLALQGGGAHGAYTWGVLDRLLEDEFMSFDAITGTSAGAVNAVGLAYGYLDGGTKGARDMLESIWRETAKAGDFLSIPTNPMEVMSKAMTSMFASFDQHPLDYDPLRKILNDHIDFEALRKHSTIGLFIAATQVSNGNAHIFETEELTIDMVLASTCLPFLSKSIVIDGEPYWDGGFSANPAIRPVILNSNTDDTLLVQLSPIDDFQLPSHFGGVRTHLNHLSFSQSLRREIELIEEGREYSRLGLSLSEKSRRLSRHRFHLIDGSDVTSRLNPGSELTPDWRMLSELRDEGRAACDIFLEQNRADIGHHSSVDLKEHFKL